MQGLRYIIVNCRRQTLFWCFLENIAPRLAHLEVVVILSSSLNIGDDNG
jgi:hypothetical protein